MKFIKRKIRLEMKRVIAVILLVVMIVSNANITAIKASSTGTENKETTFKGIDFEVNFKITSQWAGAFNANVTVKNTSDKVIDNWAIGFKLDNEITNIWNGQVYSNENGIKVIKNAGYNQDIGVGQSISFGFTAKSEVISEVMIPNSYYMVTKEAVINNADYTVTYNVTNDWGTGYNGEIIITNNSQNTIEDWILQFDFLNNIDRFWTAYIMDIQDKHCTIKNAGYNSNIKSGESVRLGFSGTPGNAEAAIENVIITEVITDANELQGDFDKDNLTNQIELLIGTNPYDSDTDKDGIDDNLELYYSLDPLKKDTDNDGIFDGDEDLDGDKLTILEEFGFGTSNLKYDTDEDNLSDYDEIYVYFTNPLVADTDGDGIDDDSEIKLGLDPLNIDTNGDGILDGQEKIQQQLSHDVVSEDKKQIIDVTISMACTGDINKTTSVENTFGEDTLSSEVVGLVGVPIEINSQSNFDEATITFHYNDAFLGDVNENDLRVMWYDEENNQYVIMDEDSVLNTENNTVSYRTTHFSTYLVVDSKEWYKVWSQALSYNRKPSSETLEYFDIGYVLDCSGSMQGSSISIAKEAIGNFIDAMLSNDRGSIVGFNSTATVYNQFTWDKISLKNNLNSIYAYGGTNVESGLVAALNEFDQTDPNIVLGVENSKIIILLCDGDVYYTEATLQRAKEMGIKIYTVLIGSTYGQSALEYIANVTGGKFYYAASSDEIRKAIFGVQGDTVGNIDTTDTDGDGLYDVYETGGMIISNGTYIKTNPLKYDTDGDGISDSEEMGVKKNPEDDPLNNIVTKILKLTGHGYPQPIIAQYLVMKSNPTKQDSDDDGLYDGRARYVSGKKVVPKDPEPLRINGPAGIWQEQYNQAYNKKVAMDYGDWYDIDWLDWELGKWPSALTGGGSYVLQFRYDNMKQSLHSNADNWQKIGGYNDVYDEMFRVGTSDNMKQEKFPFTSGGKEYVVWAWRGDYLNLGSGAEIGIYTDPFTIPIINFKQWNVVDFTLPMTLSLYNYYGKDDIDNVFSWAPNEKQWWITGFNPEFDEPKILDMVMVGTIDFTGREEMFEDLKKAVTNKSGLKKYMIFDEDGHTVWINWSSK